MRKSNPITGANAGGSRRSPIRMPQAARVAQYPVRRYTTMKTHTTVFLIVVALFSFATFTASGHPSSGIVVDQQGNVFFSDLSRGVFKIDPQGKLTTLSKEGGHWLALDTNGSFSKVEFERSAHWPRWFKRRTPAGERPALIADGGSPLVVAPDGNLYYVCEERMIPAGQQIARLTPDGKETLVSPGLRRIAEEMGGIKGLAAGPDGTFFISYPKAVLKVTRDGTFTTLLNPVVAPDCDKHPPSIQDAPALRGLVVDARGVVYVAATGCRCVIKITPDAKVATVLKAESPWAPCGVALHGEDIYVLEHINANSEAHDDWPPRVRRVGRDGKVTTLVTFAPERR
jgi:sugar lactone lactonase YvrE